MSDVPAPADRRSAPSAAGSRPPMAPSPWISFETAGHRVIVRTIAGGAPYVAKQIDHERLPGLLGTIAGNDSVAIICTDADVAERTVAELSRWLAPLRHNGSRPGSDGP